MSRCNTIFCLILLLQKIKKKRPHPQLYLPLQFYILNEGRLFLFLWILSMMIFVVWNIGLVSRSADAIDHMLIQCTRRRADQCVRVRTRDSMNEKRSEGVHPLGGPRRRHYVVYLAFNLINEGRSASFVAVHRFISLSLPFSLLVSLSPYLSFHDRIFFRNHPIFLGQEKEWRGDQPRTGGKVH